MVTNIQINQSEDNQVVSLALAKLHCKVYGDEENELIELMIASAQEMAQNVTSRPIGLQTVKVTMDGFDVYRFESVSADLIEKVEYYPGDGGGLVQLPDGAFTLSESGVYFTEPYQSSFVRNDAVVITIKRGYDAETCPKPIKQAMLLMIGDSYERREDRGEIGYNSAVHNLLRPYRKW